MNRDDLRYFPAIARAGSLTAAARALHISQSTVSRRLATIEQRLGVTLFDQAQRGYEMLDTAEHVEDTFDEIERRIVAQDRGSTGKLRVTCTQPLANQHLCKHPGEFTRAYPDVDISLSCTFEKANLNRRDADVAIRITDEPPDALIGRKIARVAVCAYGRADYLRARLGHDSDLEWIGWRDEAYNRQFITD